jgi:hypothetical protein
MCGAEEGSGKRKNCLTEQYQSYVKDLGNIGTRHENTRQFYLSVVSVVFVFLSMAGTDGPFRGVKIGVQIIVGVVGIVICVLWMLHMRSFGALYLAKFTVLREMEKDLPFPIFEREWTRLESDRRYWQFTVVDEWLPRVFILVFVAVILLK